MATYKVLSDLDAEDKLVGPFTFKQIVLLLVAGFLAFIMFLLAKINVILIAIPMPFFLVFLFFGIYRRKDQSVETYVAAILRFYFKPRKRIWAKDGVLETVKITAPKTIEKQLTDTRSREEVRNSLKSLGALMDTRGWSAKNATLQEAGVGTMALDQSDRLVTPVSVQEPQEIHESDDMLGYSGSATAQHINTMTQTMQNRARQQAIAQMQTANAAPQPTQRVTATPTQDVKYNPSPTMQQSVISPVGQQDQNQPESVANTAPSTPDQDVSQKSSSTMTTDVSPDIINLSNNNDRSIESIAKEADAIFESGDEISLHGR